MSQQVGGRTKSVELILTPADPDALDRARWLHDYTSEGFQFRKGHVEVRGREGEGLRQDVLREG